MSLKNLYDASGVLPWNNFGGSAVDSIPTSHGQLSCVTGLISDRPLSPCYYPEVTDAYIAATAAATLANTQPDTKLKLKIRFNTLDTAQIESENVRTHCDERFSDSSVFLHNSTDLVSMEKIHYTQEENNDNIRTSDTTQV